MVDEQDKRQRLKFVCNLLNMVGWGCLFSWIIGLLVVSVWLPKAESKMRKKAIAEPRTIIDAINRTQQVSQLETGRFATSLEDLEKLGWGGYMTEEYEYLFVLSQDKKTVVNIAIPKKDNFRIAVGKVKIEELVDERTNTTEPGTKASFCTAPLCAGGFSKPTESEMARRKEALSKLDLSTGSLDSSIIWPGRDVPDDKIDCAKVISIITGMDYHGTLE